MTLFSNHPSQQHFDDIAFPAFVSSTGDLSAFISQNKSAIDEALAQCGTVLFRGFDVPTANQFDQAITAYGEDGFSYAESFSNAVRVNVTPRVFTANEAPSSVSIYLHHEMAQTPLYPSKLFFYCEIAPGSGGATPICRSDVLMERLQSSHPDLAEKFETLGLRYTHTMPNAPDPDSGQGRSWRDTLGVTDRAGAENRLRAMGYDWTWVEDHALRVRTPILDAVKPLPDGRKTFFNQLIAAFRGWRDQRNDPSKSITFGDDTPIDPSDMNQIIALSEALTYDLNWQAGDVALLDNFQVMHGRRPFEGKRRVLASLIS